MPDHEPGRLPVHVRQRAAVAQEPARQRRQRRDHDRRRRRPEPQLPEHFKYDEEGSSSIFSSQTYRGPSGGSEPETQAIQGLFDRVGFSFNVNYHSAGEWLLYPEGWQVGTPTADDPIYYALSGNLDEPAIPGFHPGLSSDVLYVTNGEANDYAHNAARHAGVDPRAGRGLPGLRVRVPRRRGAGPGRVRAEPAVRASRSRSPRPTRTTRSPRWASRPSRSTSGATTRTRRASRARTSRSSTPTATRSPSACWPSAARPRDGEVQDQRRPREERERPRSGRAVSATSPHRSTTAGMRGVVTGTTPGDSVKVWFEGAASRASRSPTRRSPRRGNRVLVVAAEDYSGASPVQSAGPHHLQYYLDALAANGVPADVYDVDARGRIAPDHSACWATTTASSGTRATTSSPARPGGRAATPTGSRSTRCSSPAPTWTRAGACSTRASAPASSTPARASGRRRTTRRARRPCTCPADPADVGSAAVPPAARLDLRRRPGQRRARVLVRRLRAGRRRRHRRRRRGVRRQRHRRSVHRAGVGLQRPGRAPTTRPATRRSSRPAASCRSDEYPQFESWPSSRWDKPGGPFEPHTGEPVRLLADRRRHLQAADPRDRGAGRRRQT